MIDVNGYRRKLLAQKEGRASPTPTWIYAVVVAIVAIAALALGLIDYTRSD